MSKKHKKICGILNYFDHSLILISTITGYVSISAFASLVGIPIEIRSSATGLKMYKSIIKKKKKKYDKIVLLAKSKLNSIEVLISEALIDSNINHNEFILINNVLNEFKWYERTAGVPSSKWSGGARFLKKGIVISMELWIIRAFSFSQQCKCK